MFLKGSPKGGSAVYSLPAVKSLWVGGHMNWVKACKLWCRLRIVPLGGLESSILTPGHSLLGTGPASASRTHILVLCWLSHEAMRTAPQIMNNLEKISILHTWWKFFFMKLVFYFFLESLPLWGVVLPLTKWRTNGIQEILDHNNFHLAPPAKW